MEKYKAQAKYKKKNIKQIAFQLNINTDFDIIEFFKTLANKQSYLKEIIRKDMERRKQDVKE